MKLILTILEMRKRKTGMKMRMRMKRMRMLKNLNLNKIPIEPTKIQIQNGLLKSKLEEKSPNLNFSKDMKP